jgi:hypothetical protein
VTSALFLAGVRTLDRVRGGGWLDCPTCGEHAAQDVVDEMRFLALLGYRFTPVARRRVLVCRRCGFRRAATAEELGGLHTGGRRIQRAWLVPIGLLPFLVVGLTTLVLVSRHPPRIEDILTFGPDTAQPVAPVSLRRPLSWNASPNSDATPPDYTVTDPTQRMAIRLRRITDSTTVAGLITQHLTDDNGINDLGVPDTPPEATRTKVAGEDTLTLHFDYTSTGEDARTTLYAFFHDGVGYTLTYVAKGKSQFGILDQVADTVNGSLVFTAGETPAPCPSPSPSSSPSSSSSSSSSPSTSASPGSASSSSAASPQPPLPSFATSPQPCAGGVATASPAPSTTGSPSPR